MLQEEYSLFVYIELRIIYFNDNSSYYDAYFCVSSISGLSIAEIKLKIIIIWKY